MVAVVIVISMRLVGTLLVTAILVFPAVATYGRQLGVICAQGCPGLKAGLCRQAQMRKSGATTWLHTEKTENTPCATTFWIPVAGYPDYYVHFGIGVTIDFSARPTETA